MNKHKPYCGIVSLYLSLEIRSRLSSCSKSFAWHPKWIFHPTRHPQQNDNKYKRCKPFFSRQAKHSFALHYPPQTTKAFSLSYTMPTQSSLIQSSTRTIDTILTFLEKVLDESFWESMMGPRLVNLAKRYFGNDFVILSAVFYISSKPYCENKVNMHADPKS